MAFFSEVWLLYTHTFESNGLALNRLNFYLKSLKFQFLFSIASEFKDLAESSVTIGLTWSYFRYFKKLVFTRMVCTITSHIYCFVQIVYKKV